MDHKVIQDIIRLVNKSDLTEVEIEDKDFKLRIKRKGGEVAYISPSTAPVEYPTVIAHPPHTHGASDAHRTISTHTVKEDEVKGGEEKDNVHLHTITAPMIGTFYRQPGPDKDPFVKVGDYISKGQVLCIIEAMKLFNEIESEVEGKVVKILIENDQPVEYDQALFVVELAH